MNTSRTSLPHIVDVDEEKCVNCHACIAVCPVKFCNDGSGDYVTVNFDTCIGCGRCLNECTHQARRYLDDFGEFMEAIGSGVRTVAILPPSVAANFPERYLNLNGWLKSIGVEAVFDVSFGAELSAKSYAEHIAANNPEMVITQPCPAIVTYIELYQPALLPYLAPVDSPMLHTIKMIRRYYPQYADHRVAVISPCLAKKREFVETGLGDYNVAFISLDRYFRDNGISLDNYPAAEFDNPPAERAVLFSSPGGLLRTMERMFPDIAERTRKIEGNPVIYEYLASLPGVLAKGKDRAPLLIDCLNCHAGCNGGPLTSSHNAPPDEIEYWVERRNREMRALYDSGRGKGSGAAEPEMTIGQVIDRYWEPGLYTRTYRDLSGNATIRIPSDTEREEIYRSMHKYSEDDIYNCSSCGYGRCEHMATAIFNNLNRPENCHHYLEHERESARRKIAASERRLRNILDTTVEGFWAFDREYRITGVNPSMASILGVPAEELTGRTVTEFMDSHNSGLFAQRLDLCEGNRHSSFEVNLKRPSGEDIVCFFQATSLFGEDNACIGAFAMVSDITERKRAEEELKQYRDHLEDLVHERTTELELQSAKIRHLLDNAGEGFLTFGPDYTVRKEYSAECLEIFGCDIAGESFPSLLYPDDPGQRDLVIMTLEKVFLENEPFKQDVYLSLLPEEVTLGDRIVQIEYKLIGEYAASDRHFMIVLTDITEKRELERQMVHERNNLRMVVKVVLNLNEFNGILADFRAFFSGEGMEIIESAPEDRLEGAVYSVFKEVHTMKGNFSQFYMLDTVQRLHDLEDRLSALLNRPTPPSREEAAVLLGDADTLNWPDEDLTVLTEMVGPGFLRDDAIVSIEKQKLLELEGKIASTLLPEEADIFVAELRKLRYQPFRDLLKTYPEYVVSLADRQEKLVHPPLIEGGEIPVDPDRYTPFAKSLVHVYRNIIEHGIESPDERIDAGKDEYGTVHTRVDVLRGNRIRLTITDDGRGIDVEKVYARALERGLVLPEMQVPREELHRFIFAEGVSTRESVNELSGRGIGLSAVKQEIERIGGTVIVKTEENNGASFEFTFPVEGHEVIDHGRRKLMQYMIESTGEFFTGELGLEPDSSSEITLPEGDHLALYDISSFIDTDGEIQGKIIITAEQSLADFMLAQLILEDVAEEEREELTRETMGEVLNIVLGNTTNALAEDGLEISIDSPGSFHFREQSVRFGESTPLVYTINTPEGKCSLIVCQSVTPVA